MRDNGPDAGFPAIDRPSSSAEWRNGWVTVSVGLLGYAIATVHTYSLGVFMQPVQGQFGWSRAEMSSGFLVYSIASVLFSPVAGMLIDRCGVREVGMAGMALYCAALAMLSTMTASLWFWWSAWFIVALGGVFVKPTLWATAISSRFTVHRGVALAVMLTGSGVSSALVPSIASRLISEFGWRGAYVILGAGAAAIMLPLMLFFFQACPPGPVATGEARGSDMQPGLSVREAMLSWRFAAIGLATLLMACATIGIVVHFVPIMTGRGTSTATATLITGIVGIGSIVGRMGTGLLLDRYAGRLVGAIAFILPILPIAILLSGTSNTAIIVGVAFLIGLCVGSEVDIIAYITSRYFGLRSYGTVFGTLIGIMAMGSGMGPTLAGYAFDVGRSYAAFFWGMMPCLVVASALMASLGRYPESGLTGRPQEVAS